MKQIVILGGGFGGVTAALTLERNLFPHMANVTLIDKNSYHLFTPSLYEVATSEMPQKNIAIPLKEIFGKQINIVQNTVQRIDTSQQKVILENSEEISFDYLIMALGSEASYFGIEGLQEYSLPLKRITDAVKIRDAIHKLFDTKIAKGETAQIIIGGGGFSGTELAGELIRYREMLAKEHKLSANELEISIVQGSNHLLKELDEKVSLLAEKRITCEEVKLSFGEHIKKVTKDKIFLDNGETQGSDLLIWTGGVGASKVLKKSGFATNKSGQVLVNSHLQVAGFEKIFAVGDTASFTDPKTGEPAPGVVQVAQEEARVAAENIVRHMDERPLKMYEYKHFGYIIPLKGKFAVVVTKHFHIKGIAGWLFQQIIFLRYFLSILSIFKAFRRWNRFEKDLEIDSSA